MKNYLQFLNEKQIDFDVVKYILKDCAGIDYEWNLSEERLIIKSKENLHFIVYLDKILANNLTDKYLIQKFICQQNSTDYLLLKDVDSRIKEEYGDVADASDLGLFFKESLNINLGFIEKLYINSLGLTEISWVSQLNNLTYLYCYNNQLKELPELPGSLTHLDCSNNQLKELPELPNSLTYLNCENNPGYDSWKKDKKYNKFNI